MELRCFILDEAASSTSHHSEHGDTQGTGQSRMVSGRKPPSGRHSVDNSRRARGGDTFDRAIDGGVRVGACHPNAKGLRSAQRDRHRAGDTLAAAFSVN